MKAFKPMLADNTQNITDAMYADILAASPMCGSYKLDGIRCVIKDGKALTRSLKEIPNRHIFSVLSNPALNGLDGEIVVGHESENSTFNRTTSEVMSHDGVPDFKFRVFDLVDFNNPQEPFNSRYARMLKHPMVTGSKTLNVAGFPVSGKEVVVPVEQILLENLEQMTALEERALSLGYEGLILKHPFGPYKFGRSTFKERWLMKVKRFIHAEAIILEVYEKMHNDNVATTNELGRTQRSSAQAGLIGANTLGGFKVRDLVHGWEFNIGSFSGLTDAMKKEIWDNRDKYIGAIARYKYMPHGMLDKPRIPIFQGFRSKLDMDD